MGKIKKILNLKLALHIGVWSLILLLVTALNYFGTLELILNLASRIPNVVWSGVIAAMLAFGGVFLSNKTNIDALVKKMAHESDEKEKDRKSTLRREVYLDAAQESVNANMYLATLSTIDVTKTNAAEGLKGFYIAAAKVQLIAENETALLANRLYSKYGEVLLKLLTCAKPIFDNQIEINVREPHIEQARNEVQRLLSAMTQYNESGKNEPSQFQVLQNSFSFHQGKADRIGSEQQEYREKNVVLYKQFSSVLMNEMKEITKLQIPLLKAMRKELSIDTDDDRLEAMITSVQDESIANLEKFLEVLA